MRTGKPDEKRLYFHVYDWPDDGAVEIPGIFSQITGARLLESGEELEASRPSESLVRINIPAEPIDQVATVIVLDYQGELRVARYQADK